MASTTPMEPAYVDRQPRAEQYQQVGNSDDHAAHDPARPIHEPPHLQGTGQVVAQQTTVTRTTTVNDPHGAVIPVGTSANATGQPTVVATRPTTEIVQFNQQFVSGPPPQTTHLGTACVILALVAFVAVAIVGLAAPMLKIREEPIAGTYQMDRDWRTTVKYFHLHVDAYTAGGNDQDAGRSDWDQYPGLTNMRGDFRAASALIITSLVVAVIMIVLECLRFCGKMSSGVGWRVLMLFLFVTLVVFVAVGHGLTAKTVDDNIDEYVDYLTRTSPAASLSTRWAGGIVVYWIFSYVLLGLLALFGIRTVFGLSRCPCAFVPDPKHPAHPHSQ